MNYQMVNGKQIICFPKVELMKLFDSAQLSKFWKEVYDQNITFDDLKQNNAIVEQLTDDLGLKLANERDAHEIFAALYVFLDFYPSGSEVCFELTSEFNRSKDSIRTIEDLNRYRSDPPDFIIKSDDGFRNFELKRYRDSLETQEMFNFLKKKLIHYANNLEDMNLLVALQSKDPDVSGINFHQLHDQIKVLGLKFPEQILIAYNENNTEWVINQVYPELTTTRIPFRFASELRTSMDYEV